MKKIFLPTIVLITALATPSHAQTINWLSLQENQKHIATATVGWEHAAILGVGYAYKLDTKLPLIANAQFSVPSGANLTDDFKAKLGLQARVLKSGNFVTSISAYGIFRRYQDELALFKNFGAEFTLVSGYYKPRWFVAAEFGFDKAITTHIQSSELMRQNYPAATDGWFVPTGGNFIYGLQTGYTIRSFDITLKAGQTIDQSFDWPSMVPYYVQFGVNKRF